MPRERALRRTARYARGGRRRVKEKSEGIHLFERDFDFAVVVKIFAGYLLDGSGQLSCKVESARALNRASLLLWVLADMEVGHFRSPKPS